MTDSEESTPNKGNTLLTDKTRIHLRSASVWTYTFFTTGIPYVLINPRSKEITGLIYLYLLTYTNPNLRLN
jgi:hypothetical protein